MLRHQDPVPRVDKDIAPSAVGQNGKWPHPLSAQMRRKHEFDEILFGFSFH